MKKLKDEFIKHFNLQLYKDFTIIESSNSERIIIFEFEQRTYDIIKSKLLEFLNKRKKIGDLKDYRVYPNLTSNLDKNKLSTIIEIIL